MPIATQCPACGRKLKAPDQLLGKSVRCPNCKESFKVTQEPPDEAPAETSVTARPGKPKRKPPPADDDAVTVYPEKSKRKAPARDDDDENDQPRRRRHKEPEEDDAYADEDEDERYEADRRRKDRRKRRRAEASRLVAPPAIALMSVGGLALLLSAVSLMLNLLGTALIAAPQVQGGGPGGPDTIAHAVGGVMGAIFGLCWGGIIVSGAWKMYSLSGYAYAMTATIVAMVPCNLCCLLGLPFGIWSLVILCRADVKDAFR